MGGPVGLHGHGLRARLLLGPAEYGGVAAVGEIEVRRYQCQRCLAVVVVCPRAVRPRYLYTGVAIALGLSLWTEGLVRGVDRSRV